MDIPSIGLGTFAIKDAQVAIDSIRYAIEEVGYRYIDTACVYQNEEVLGEALFQVFQNGKVKRDEVFITTKLWSTYRRPEYVSLGLSESLKKLKLDYVDLYLILLHLFPIIQKLFFQKMKIRNLFGIMLIFWTRGLKWRNWLPISKLDSLECLIFQLKCSKE